MVGQGLLVPANLDAAAARALPPLRLLLLASGPDAARLEGMLRALDRPVEIARAASAADARTALVRDDWSVVVVAWPLPPAAEALADAPWGVLRVLLVDALTTESLRASQRLGALLCTSDATQLEMVLAHGARGAAAQAANRAREEFDAEQVRILERVAAGAELDVVLERIVHLIERGTEGLCSILLVDLKTRQVRHGAAPSLPPAFVQALDGERIGPGAGSCGTAAYTGEAVFVRDIETHPYWRAYRDVALPHGLRACWSTPIHSPDGEVLGTFAVYYDRPRDPSQEELRRVASATHLAAVAIMRQRSERALRVSEQRYRQLLETTHEAVLMLSSDGRIVFVNQRAAAMLGCAPQELVGLPFQEVVDPSEQARVERALASRRAGEGEQYELHMRARDGRDVWAIVAASPILSESGEVAGVLKMLTDITERRRTEQALARSELELRLLFESTKLGIALMDASSRPMRFNSQFQRILGYELDELRATPVMSLVHPDDLASAGEKRRQLNTREERVAELELRLFRKDGSTVWVRAISSRFAPDDPSDLTGVTIIEDVTERRKLEEAFRAEQRLRAVVYESVSELICYLAVEPDDCFRVVSVNPAYTRITGRALHEVVGKPVEQVMSASSASVKAHYRLAIEERRTVRWDESGRSPSGQDEHGEVTATPVFDADGRCTNLIVTARMVTERKRNEAKIAQQAALLERAHDAIVLCSMDHVVRFWNASAERLYGFTAQEAVGRSLKELLRDDAAAFERAERELFERGSFTGELTQHAKDGREVVVDSSWTLLRDAKGEPESVLAIHTDATEKKRLQAQVMQAQRMESLGTLAGGIAHDFNNILAAIRGYLELAMQSLPARSPAGELLGVVRTATDRAVDLVHQILTFSRRKPAQRVPLRLRPVIEEVLQLLRATLPRMIQLDAELTADDQPVLADATQIHQILMNLGTNAAQALGSHGTITFRLARIVLSERVIGVATEVPAGPTMRMTIVDDGCGMDGDTLEHIFDPFFTTKAPGLGTGLGLSVVLGIVKAHGGAIQVASAPGGGTRFDIYLPIVETTDARPLLPALAPALHGHGERLLCVDDEPVLLDLERAFLERLGYRVESYASPREALRALGERPRDFAAIITDLAMPELSGLELAAAAQYLAPDVPIILASGYVRAEQREQARKAGIRAIVEKPDMLDPLAHELVRLLRPARDAR